MKKVSVPLDKPSYYAESEGRLYRLKRRLTLKPILSILNKFIKGRSSFSLLELGGGSGFLLSFLEDKYPDSSLVGLEYDERLIPIIKSKTKKSKILQGNAEDFNLNETFDIIVSLQVIEHLYQPELMLLNARKHLKPGGVFIFTTPNPVSFSARVMKKRWHGYRDDHVSMKAPAEWVRLSEQVGFKTIYSGTTFFTGIPVFNKLPFGILNWVLLYFFGSLPWQQGESFVGIFKNGNE